ncbi:Hypothetical predicted protein [Mytilus galloprovincialis]|uniref:Uncharacterized protein n=1 Tax=Mytilus galloprovincialis TaxID=29158 RepID=A0A8B6DQP2_MYTGA|nr:Hypothetical predicted protein [Mytilus galloprovincialis]
MKNISERVLTKVDVGENVLVAIPMWIEGKKTRVTLWQLLLERKSMVINLELKMEYYVDFTPGISLNYLTCIKSITRANAKKIDASINSQKMSRRLTICLIVVTVITQMKENVNAAIQLTATPYLQTFVSHDTYDGITYYPEGKRDGEKRTN